MVLCIRLNKAGKWACNRLTEDADLGKQESFFRMKLILILAGGYVNKQNCRIWGAENPHAYIENPMSKAKTSNYVVRILVKKHNWGHYSSKMSQERPLQSM